jgi:cytochrome c oxidase cbb3-type subunit 3
MKFINYLERITGVGIYPLSSLLIFFVFFTVVAIWVYKADKGYMDSMKNIPFPSNDNLN